MDQEHSVKIVVTEIRSAEGSVIITLHRSSKKFPSDPSAILLSSRVKAVAGGLEVTFPRVPDGDYAVAIHHDENDDGEMNYNLLGIPKEGFGFSGNKPVLFGAPSFENAKISISEDAKVPVRMKYF